MEQLSRPPRSACQPEFRDHNFASDMKDAFFSEEDLDLRSLSFKDLNQVWNAWLRQAQSTNEHDRHEYSHGVFKQEPIVKEGDENSMLSDGKCCVAAGDG